MTITRHLIGYDQSSEEELINVRIPPEKEKAVLRLIELHADDPEAFDVYPLSPDQTARIADLLSCSLDPYHCDFFLQTFADLEEVRSRIAAVDAV